MKPAHSLTPLPKYLLTNTLPTARGETPPSLPDSCFLSSEDSRTEVQNQVPTKKPCRARGAGTCAVGRPGGYRQERILPEATRYNRTTRFQTRFPSKRSNSSLENSWEEAKGLQEEMQMGKRGLIVLFSFPLSWPHHTACRILVPVQELNPCPCSGSVGPNPLDHQGTPQSFLQILHQGKGT